MLYEQAQTAQTVWLSLNRETGKFRTKMKDGNYAEYSTVEGRLLGIKVNEFEWNGKSIQKAVIMLQDDEYYELQIGLRTFTALQILNSLASIENTYSKVQITGYIKDGNVQCKIKQESSGQLIPLGWYYDVDYLKKTKVFGKQKTVDALSNTIDSLIDKINHKTNYKPNVDNSALEDTELPATNPDDDDLPF